VRRRPRIHRPSAAPIFCASRKSTVIGWVDPIREASAERC
jgi:hypothetical protein